MRLGEILRKWRLMMEIEQKVVARDIGISESTLCRIEKGQGCDANNLGKVLRWLLKDEEER